MNRILILRTLLLSGFLLLFSACEKEQIPASPTSFEQVDATVTDILKKEGLMSLSVAVVKNDKLIFSKGYGLANQETKRPATNESIFLIASVSKTVTGMAAMQLVEQGKLNLDTDINSYLPFKLTNPKNPKAVITCRHLMTHTATIVDAHYEQVANPALYTFGADPTLSLADFARAFFVTGGTYYSPNSFGPGSPGGAYTYTNLGIALLGYVVEVVAKKPFDQYTNEMIFRPLGMTKTSWRLRDLPAAELAMPYTDQNKPYGHYTFADYPNGGLRTTVNDLSNFLRAVMLGGAFNGKRVLSAASVAELQRIQYPTVSGAERQGLVWGHVRPADVGATPAPGLPAEVFGHAGGEQGVFTLMFFDPVTRAGAIVFTNEDIASEQGYQRLIDLELSLIKLGAAQ
ncbi:MAG: class A beta-lactamase-related serine hydrolase [Cytophagales bacterium]|nr:MAG: class A beta-lactamase-related serine hydrolase [Cytophagales bacterium]